MPISFNGNNITITGATIELVNGANDESGVAYLIITPDGGVGQLPFVAEGAPGQPTLFPTITLVQLPAGEGLPSPNPVTTLIDAGGPGLPAKYALTFYVNAGATGLTGTPSIALASDLATSPTLGITTEKFIPVFRNSDSKFVMTAQKVGPQFVSGTIASTTFNNVTPRLLSSINVPAQPWDWRPNVFAATTVAGSDGATPTRVDLFARINNEASGDICGYARGLVGANVPGIQTVMIPTYLHNADVTGAYAKVTAGNASTIHLRAEQVNASSSSWSTPASPATTFVVEVQPIP